MCAPDDYRVVFVADEELPTGVDFAVARQEDGTKVAYLKESQISPRMLERVWRWAVELETSIRYASASTYKSRAGLVAAGVLPLIAPSVLPGMLN